MPNYPVRLELSTVQKKELVSFMKNTHDKEEYRRASAIKQKMEGVPYRTIAKNLGVNYRNVYDWIKKYRESGLDGIRNKRKNGGRKPVISTDRNKQMIKDIVLNKSPKTFGYLKNTWSIRLLAIYLTSLLEMNVSPMQTWRIIQDLGIVYKQPKLELEKGDDYEEKKKKIDRYKKISSALLKKILLGFEDETWLHLQPYITRTYMMKGEQQKILHKGSNDKVNAFITLLYPLNRIKFNTSKTRRSNDFINHLKSIKRYVRKRGVKRFIIVIDNASFHVSKKTKQFLEKQSDWLTVLFLPTRSPFLNLVETRVNRNLKKDVCANYNYETEENLLCTVRKYLRKIGSWPKL